MTNEEIIDKITLMCSEKIGKQLFLLEQILNERDSLEFVEETLYERVAGLVLMLNPTGDDTSTDPTLIREENIDSYESERRILLRYFLTLIHHEVKGRKNEAYNECLQMLKTTGRTFSKNFLSVVNLIILFDSVEPYTYLCKPLATFCADIMHNEFNKMTADA